MSVYDGEPVMIGVFFGGLFHLFSSLLSIAAEKYIFFTEHLLFNQYLTHLMHSSSCDGIWWPHFHLCTLLTLNTVYFVHCLLWILFILNTVYFVHCVLYTFNLAHCLLHTLLTLTLHSANFVHCHLCILLTLYTLYLLSEHRDRLFSQYTYYIPYIIQ